jgi:glycosyltransferase involved in cell wall biosynthesis
MVTKSHRVEAYALDPTATTLAIRGAFATIILTDDEGRALSEVVTGGNLVRMPNGVPLRPSVVPATQRTREVLFCGRLHPRKRVAAFVEMTNILRRRGVDARFVVAGPDQGSLSELRSLTRHLGLEDVLTYEGPLPIGEAPDRLASAYVYVLPSLRELFPMALLEAVGAGTPSVCTRSCELSGPLGNRAAVVVSDGSPEDLADRVQELLDDSDLWHRVSDAGRQAVASEYGISAVVDRLEELYQSALSSAGSTSND